ncbi:MAG: hypothetical protein H9534_03815 [Dolichospermum circinale Clear-D4]|nr:hypothetical protein [Dolichospermum circinale Clear-D4]
MEEINLEISQTNQMKELAEALAQTIVSAISEEWEVAKFTILVIGRSVDYQLDIKYIDKFVEGEYFEEVGVDSLTKIILDVNRRMNKVNPNHWNEIRFELLSNGDFDIKFLWNKKVEEDMIKFKIRPNWEY